VYVESKVRVSSGTDEITVTAQAGIDPNRKGMDIAQSFGSSSSYARKYALNAMFLIDDTKDADATNTHGKDSQPLQDALNKLSGMSSKAEAIEWAKTLPDSVKTHESFRQAFSKKF
jgi:hypothetical protein